MENEKIFIKKFFLRKLVILGKIGGSHTSFYNLPKGLPLHLRSNKKGKKTIKKAIKELLNEGFLLSKLSTNEQHVSINPRKMKEIEEFLEI